MTNDGMRTYLSRVLPWEAGGYINIHWASQREGFARPIYSGRACTTVEEAVRAVEFALRSDQTLAVYACQSAQSTCEEKVSANGYPYRNAVRSAANALGFKSLFLDIDIREEGNGYRTVGEAVAALKSFCEGSGLPKPTLTVWSGSGLHVYWVSRDVLRVSEWKDLSLALATAAKTLGLKCDTQCTVDAARILRVPGTWNKKHGKAVPVRIAGSPVETDYSSLELRAALDIYLHSHIPGEQRPVASDLAPLHPLEGTSDLSAGIVRTTAPVIELGRVGDDCPFVRQALTTGGKDYSNPLWHLLVLITTFCEDGRAQAHAVSKGYPTYTPEETDALFDRKEREKVERGLGWPSCAAIDAAGCTDCRSCPNFGKGKSPLHFARSQPTVLPARPASDLPDNYTRNPSGFIFTTVLNKDTGEDETIQLCAYPMTDPWLQWDPHILHFSTVLDNGRVSVLHIPMTACGTDDGVRRTLSEQAVVLQKSEAQHVQRFLVAWIQKLQKARAAVASAPFGWQVNERGELDGFVYAGQIWSKNGSAPATNPDPILGRQYQPVGEEARWRKAVALILDQKRPGLDALVASAFAAPLVRFTGVPGLLLSTFSEESGIGKTTALKVAQAVWGDPVRAMQGLSDTQNSVLKKIGEIRTLPLYWDELKTEEDTLKFVNLVFQLSLGKEKSRLSSSTQMRDVGVWQTLMVSASNESLLDYVVGKTKQTTAGLYRVFEYELSPAGTGAVGQIAPAEAQRIIAALNENYGQIGLQYAQWLGANSDRCDQDVSDYLAQLGKTAAIQADERFWGALVACVVVGARYANELKLAAFDVQALETFMLDTLRRMRKCREEQPVDMKQTDNVMELFAQFLNTHRRQTLLTNTFAVGKRSGVEMRGNGQNIDNVRVHIALEDKSVRVSSSALGEWLADQGMHRSQFFSALERQVGVKRAKLALGAGTPYGGFPEWCLELDFKNRTDISFMEH